MQLDAAYSERLEFSGRGTTRVNHMSESTQLAEQLGLEGPKQTARRGSCSSGKVSCDPKSFLGKRL
jgi:hypothetical protein